MMKNRIIYAIVLGFALSLFATSYVWAAWYILVMVIALPVFSILLSIIPMIRSKLELTAPARPTRGANEYLRCRCGFGWNLFSAPPRCRARIKVLYTMTDDEHVYDVTPVRGVNPRIRLDTRHCGHVKITVSRAYVYDYLGLIRLRVRTGAMPSIYILPVAEKPPYPCLENGEAPIALRPKPGGGYSEEYELREYREGDSLRDVHWKLTAKTDTLIVREPQIPDHRRRAVVTVDLEPHPDDNDAVLDYLAFAGEWLLMRGIDIELHWRDSLGEERSEDISGETGDLRKVYPLFPIAPYSGEGSSLSGRFYANADIRCHISLCGGDS